MNLNDYIDLNIKLLTKYLKNPTFPGRAIGIDVCLYSIKQAEASGAWDKEDAQLALAELKEFRIWQRLI
jgi:hypothetical protein